MNDFSGPHGTLAAAQQDIVRMKAAVVSLVSLQQYLKQYQCKILSGLHGKLATAAHEDLSV